VLWKITPLFATWISSNTNPFWQSPNAVLHSSATVIELGCGISGLVALTLAPLVGEYVATDQEYVRKLFRQNIDENAAAAAASSTINRKKKKGGASKKTPKPSKKNTTTTDDGDGDSNYIKFIPLDWELDIPSNEILHGTTKTPTTGGGRRKHGFDLLVSCDCIYNEALVPSFVRTCADICALRAISPRTENDDEAPPPPSSTDSAADKEEEDGEEANPTIAIIAQQQRSPEVFETWLRETLRYFRVWRLDSSVLAAGGLGEGSGYTVHALVLRRGGA
jgi:predicted nicotinamide N-methyase